MQAASAFKRERSSRDGDVAEGTGRTEAKVAKGANAAAEKLGIAHLPKTFFCDGLSIPSAGDGQSDCEG